MKKTKYSAKIISLLMALLMLSSVIILPASAATAPKAPATITATPTTSSIKLTWSKVSGATGYRIYYKLPGDISWRTGLSSTASTTHTFKGLPEGQSYTFAVRSYTKSNGKITWGSYKQIATATKTAAPKKLTATQTTSAIKLTWSKVESAKGYRIFYKTASSDPWNVIVKSTDKTTYTFKDLPSGKKYIFAVRSYTKSAFGTFYGNYKTIETATKPATPKVSATSTESSISLKWNKVSGADGYRVYYKTGSSGWKTAVSSTTATSKTFNTTKNYIFAVRAYINTASGTIWSGYKEIIARAFSTPETKENIVSAYINGVNALKNTKNFTMNKNDTLNITIDEITGGSMVQSFLNTLIPSPSPESYTFVGGVDSATNATPNSTIAPLNKAAKVDVNAVTSAVAQQNPDGGYTIQLVIQPEVQTLSSPAPNLSTMVQVYDANTLLPAGFTIQEMTVNYAPTTITAVFDSLNRIVSMQHILVSQGGGSGNILGITATTTMHGDYTSAYTISYN